MEIDSIFFSAYLTGSLPLSPLPSFFSFLDRYGTVCDLTLVILLKKKKEKKEERFSFLSKNLRSRRFNGKSFESFPLFLYILDPKFFSPRLFPRTFLLDIFLPLVSLVESSYQTAQSSFSRIRCTSLLLPVYKQA